MAESQIFRKRQRHGVDRTDEYEPSKRYRDPRGWYRKTADNLVSDGYATFLLGAIGVFAIALPAFTPICIVLSLLYWWVLSRRKFRLPLRMPQTATGHSWKRLHPRLPLKVPSFKRTPLPDWGHYDRKKQVPRPAGGILYLGNDQETGEQLWLTNEDIRTHMFYAGTTGAGKTKGFIGMVTNALAWASGFLFTDGKGDVKTWDDLLTLARRFGRDDDILLVNFMKGDSDHAGNSNTINLVGKSSAANLSEVVSGLMSSGPSGSGDMWANRATAFIFSIFPALTEKRERDPAGFLLDVEKVRDHLELDAVIRLYKEGLAGGLTEQTTKGVRAYLASIPGFSFEAMEQGQPQETGALEQHGYLAMQFTKIFNELTDTYGYIFRAPKGDVDFDDVVLNRRILVVLLPALEKSESSLSGLGKIIVALVKSMMARNLGSEVEGERGIVDNRATNSKTPFVTIFDELGLYCVVGMAVMFQQARALGFSLAAGAQDFPGLEKNNKDEPMSILGSANLKLFGKVSDPFKTLELFLKSTDRALVTEGGGMRAENSSEYVDTREARVESRERGSYRDLQAQGMGEAHILYEDNLVRADMFYVEVEPITNLRRNHYIIVRTPKVVSVEGRDRDLKALRDLIEEEVEWLAGEAPASPPASRNDVSFGNLDLIEKIVARPARPKVPLERFCAAVGAVSIALSDTPKIIRFSDETPPAAAALAATSTTETAAPLRSPGPQPSAPPAAPPPPPPASLPIPLPPGAGAAPVQVPVAPQVGAAPMPPQPRAGPPERVVPASPPGGTAGSTAGVPMAPEAGRRRLGARDPTFVSGIKGPEAPSIPPPPPPGPEAAPAPLKRADETPTSQALAQRAASDMAALLRDAMEAGAARATQGLAAPQPAAEPSAPSTPASPPTRRIGARRMMGTSQHRSPALAKLAGRIVEVRANGLVELDDGHTLFLPTQDEAGRAALAKVAESLGQTPEAAQQQAVRMQETVERASEYPLPPTPPKRSPDFLLDQLRLFVAKMEDGGQS